MMTYELRVTKVFAVYIALTLQKYDFSTEQPKVFPKTFGHVTNCSYFCTVHKINTYENRR